MAVSQLFLRERTLHAEQAILLGGIEHIGAERLLKIAELSIRSGPRSRATLSLLRQPADEGHSLPRLYVVDVVAEHELDQGATIAEADDYSPYGIRPPRDAMNEPLMIGSMEPYQYLFEEAYDNGVMYAPPVNTMVSIDAVGRVAVGDVSYFGTDVYANWVHATRQNMAVA